MVWAARFVSTAGEHAKLVTGANIELGEHFVQVIFDRPRAHEQLGSDFRVGQAVAGKPGDLGLPGGELGVRIGGAFAYPLAGGAQLARGSFSEPVGSYRCEHPVCGAQLLARVDAAVLASQPFTVEQVGAGERPADAGAAEPVDRLAVEAIGNLAVAQQRL